MKTNIALAFLVTVLAFITSARATDIVAHRGASYDAPENTLASNRLAWAQKADAIETDIHLTKDGKIIVLHDKTTKRTAGLNAKIADLTFDEARKLDAGSWKDAKFAGEKLPTLEEQLALIPPGKRFLIEIKTGPEIVPELKRILEKSKVDRRNLVILSFNYKSLQAVRKQIPDITTYLLYSYKSPEERKPNAKPHPTIDDLIAQAKKADLSALSLKYTWPLTPKDMKKIKDAGLDLHVWIVDDAEIARHWIALGAKSITTNRPGWLREQLGL